MSRQTPADEDCAVGVALLRHGRSCSYTAYVLIRVYGIDSFLDGAQCCMHRAIVVQRSEADLDAEGLLDGQDIAPPLK